MASNVLMDDLSPSTQACPTRPSFKSVRFSPLRSGSGLKGFPFPIQRTPPGPPLMYEQLDENLTAWVHSYFSPTAAAGILGYIVGNGDKGKRVGAHDLFNAIKFYHGITTCLEKRCTRPREEPSSSQSKDRIDVELLTPLLAKEVLLSYVSAFRNVYPSPSQIDRHLNHHGMQRQTAEGNDTTEGNDPRSQDSSNQTQITHSKSDETQVADPGERDSDENESNNASQRSVCEIRRTADRGEGVFSLVDLSDGAQIMRERNHLLWAPFDYQRKKVMTLNVLHSDFRTLPPGDKLYVDRLSRMRGIVDPVEAAFRANSHALQNNAERREVYRHISKINHSCTPNAAMSWNRKGTVTFINAIQRIQAGDEITIFYPTDFGAHNRDEIEQQFGFKCRCGCRQRSSCCLTNLSCCKPS